MKGWGCYCSSYFPPGVQPFSIQAILQADF